MDAAYLLALAGGFREEGTMNCDDVFAILTRGPFPSGDHHDQLVEGHLQHCLECQRLAEALRPNDENRPEAVAPEDTVSLPGYWGGPLHAEILPNISLAQTAGQLPPRPKRSPSVARARGRQRISRISLSHFAAAVALGIVVAAVVRTLIGITEPPQRAPLYVPSQFAAASNGVPISDLELAIDRPRSNCLRGSGETRESPWEGVDRNGIARPAHALIANCCTACHHGGEEAIELGSSDKRAFYRSCNLCHQKDQFSGP